MSSFLGEQQQKQIKDLGAGEMTQCLKNCCSCRGLGSVPSAHTKQAHKQL